MLFGRFGVCSHSYRDQDQVAACAAFPADRLTEKMKVCKMKAGGLYGGLETARQYATNATKLVFSPNLAGKGRLLS